MFVLVGYSYASGKSMTSPTPRYSHMVATRTNNAAKAIESQSNLKTIWHVQLVLCGYCAVEYC